MKSISNTIIDDTPIKILGQFGDIGSFKSLFDFEPPSLTAQDSLGLSVIDSAYLAAQDSLGLSAIDSAYLAAQDSLGLSAIDSVYLATQDSLGLPAIDSAYLTEQVPCYDLLITRPKGETVKNIYNIDSKAVQIGDSNTQNLVEQTASSSDDKGTVIAHRSFIATVTGAIATVIGLFL